MQGVKYQLLKLRVVGLVLLMDLVQTRSDKADLSSQLRKASRRILVSAPGSLRFTSHSRRHCKHSMLRDTGRAACRAGKPGVVCGAGAVCVLIRSHYSRRLLLPDRRRQHAVWHAFCSAIIFLKWLGRCCFLLDVRAE
jgi:hypothetical protein